MKNDETKDNKDDTGETKAQESKPLINLSKIITFLETTRAEYPRQYEEEYNHLFSSIHGWGNHDAHANCLKPYNNEDKIAELNPEKLEALSQNLEISRPFVLTVLIALSIANTGVLLSLYLLHDKILHDGRGLGDPVTNPTDLTEILIVGAVSLLIAAIVAYKFYHSWVAGEKIGHCRSIWAEMKNGELGKDKTFSPPIIQSTAPTFDS